MKTKLIIAIALLVNTIAGAQTSTETATLLPDQNPNYKNSIEKYSTAQSNDVIAKEGTTVQQTYKAIDEFELKKENKLLRQQQRQDRRLARINARHRPTNRYYQNGYNNGYYGNNQNGYNNGYYGTQSNGLYYPQYYSNNIYGNVNSILGTAFLGLSILSLLKH